MFNNSTLFGTISFLVKTVPNIREYETFKMNYKKLCIVFQVC